VATDYGVPGGSPTGAALAKDRAGDVASSAAQHAQDVAGTASEQASAVAQHATEQARNVMHDAKAQAHDQARQQAGQLADSLERWRDQARALVDGRPEQAGAVGDIARQATDRLTTMAEHVRSRGFDGLVSDVERFARRRPGTFLVGCAVLGLATGRLVRSGALSQSGSSGPLEQSGSNGSQGRHALPSSGASLPSAPAPLDRVTGAGATTELSAQYGVPATMPGTEGGLFVDAPGEEFE